MAIRYWLAVVHRDHVLSGVAQGIAQAGHGARGPISLPGESDGFVYYSPRTAIDGDRLQAFTAIGRVADDEVYQTASGHSWRRRIDWDHAAVETPIRPLLGMLDFTSDRVNWGYQLRRGVIELTKHDFQLIRRQMQPGLSEDRYRQL